MIKTIGDLIVELLKYNGSKKCNYFRMQIDEDGDLVVYSAKENSEELETQKNVETRIGKQISYEVNAKWKM